MKKLLFIFLLLPFSMQAQSNDFDIRSADHFIQPDPFSTLVLRMENPCSVSSTDALYNISNTERNIQNGKKIDTKDTACNNYQKLQAFALETSQDRPNQQEVSEEKSLYRKPWFIAVCVVTAAALIAHYSTM